MSRTLLDDLTREELLDMIYDMEETISDQENTIRRLEKDAEETEERICRLLEDAKDAAWERDLND